MPYYDTKQPRSRLFGAADERADDNVQVTPLLTSGLVPRLHLYIDGHVVIGKPRFGRIVAGFFSKGLTFFALWTGGSLVLFGLHPFGPGNAASNTISASMISVAAMNLWVLAGPDDLDFDTQQRTYQYRRGLLYFAPTRQGTFNDIRTVEVQAYPMQGRKMQYSLVLLWNVPRRGATNLGQFQTFEQADAQRAQLLDALAL